MWSMTTWYVRYALCRLSVVKTQKISPLVSFGGAGGLHVCALAEELEMTNALIPVNAGVLSALGMLAADASRERSRTINRCLQDCDEEDIERVFTELVRHTREELNTSRSESNGEESYSDKTEPQVMLTVDVRYQGQSNSLNLPWQGLQNIGQAFHQKHKASYGHDLDVDIELVNVRVRATEKRQSFELPQWQPEQGSKEAFTDMPGIKEPVRVINRAALANGQQINGPALIIETSSTTWLAEGWMAQVDDVGNFKLLKI